MEALKLDKLLEKNCPVVFSIHYNININPIIKDKNGWSYLIQKTDLSTQRLETSYYYSENKVTIERHREKMAKQLNTKSFKHVVSNAWVGHSLKPTLIDILISKFRSR